MTAIINRLKTKGRGARFSRANLIYIILISVEHRKSDSAPCSELLLPPSLFHIPRATPSHFSSPPARSPPIRKKKSFRTIKSLRVHPCLSSPQQLGTYLSFLPIVSDVMRGRWEHLGFWQGGKTARASNLSAFEKTPWETGPRSVYTSSSSSSSSRE